MSWKENMYYSVPHARRLTDVNSGSGASVQCTSRREGCSMSNLEHGVCHGFILGSAPNGKESGLAGGRGRKRKSTTTRLGQRESRLSEMMALMFGHGLAALSC